MSISQWVIVSQLQTIFFGFIASCSWCRLQNYCCWHQHRGTTKRFCKFQKFHFVWHVGIKLPQHPTGKRNSWYKYQNHVCSTWQWWLSTFAIPDETFSRVKCWPHKRSLQLLSVKSTPICGVYFWYNGIEMDDFAEGDTNWCENWYTDNKGYLYPLQLFDDTRTSSVTPGRLIMNVHFYLCFGNTDISNK